MVNNTAVTDVNRHRGAMHPDRQRDLAPSTVLGSWDTRSLSCATALSLPLDPERHLRDAIACYPCDAIVDAIAIFAGKRTLARCPMGRRAISARSILPRARAPAPALAARVAALGQRALDDAQARVARRLPRSSSDAGHGPPACLTPDTSHRPDTSAIPAW